MKLAFNQQNRKENDKKARLAFNVAYFGIHTWYVA